MELFNQPFVAFNDSDAQRCIITAAQPDTSLWQHSEDFSLYHVATYDNELGTFENHQPPRLIAKVQPLIRIKKDEYHAQQQQTLRDSENDDL